ncbi:MAG: glycosyltransferase family 39 protein [Candidatus Saccharimonadaceae bacterium]
MNIWDKLFRRKDQKFNKHDWLILGGGLAAFIAISLGNITRWSIWFDEAFSVYLTRFSFTDATYYTAVDVHPPLYYWLLKIWQAMFGNSELALRSMSLVFVVVAMVFVYLLIRKMFDRRAAGWTMLFMVLSPMLVRYSEEARMYGLLMAIVAAATYVLVNATEKSTRAKWITYGVLVSLGMWTHYFTALIWLAHWAWRYISVRTGKRAKTRKAFFSREWILAHVVAIALFLPWLPVMLKQMLGIQATGFWISPVSIMTPFNFISNLFTYRENWEMVGWFALLGTALIALLTYLFVKTVASLKGKQKSYFQLLMAISLVPVLLLIVLSLPPLRPAFVERYLLAALPFWSALFGVAIAYGLSKKETIFAGKVTAALLVVAMISGIAHVYNTGNYNKNNGDYLPIRQTMRELQRLSSEGQPTLTTAYGFYEIHYYGTDRNPVYFDNGTIRDWGSMEMIKNSDYRKVEDVEAFARSNGGKIWYIGSWKKSNPGMPSSGKWKVLRSVNASEVQDDQEVIRAVEIELQ